MTSPTTVMSRHFSKKCLICIEGGIGVGKTTLLREVEALNLPGVAVVYEPVDAWRGVTVNKTTGQTLLGGLYSGEVSPSAFQLAIMPHRVLGLNKVLTNPEVRIVISERSPWSERFVFARSTLSAADYEAYVWAQTQTLEHTCILDCDMSICFLTLSTELLKQRINLRGRSEESSITDDYLTQLESAHHHLLQMSSAELGLKTSPIVQTLDATLSPVELAKKILLLCR